MQRFDPQRHPHLCALDEKVKSLIASDKARGWDTARLEFEICKLHPVYFLEEYGKIRPGQLDLGVEEQPEGGVIPFVLNPVQLLIADRVCAHYLSPSFQRVQIIILKHRKAGISTLCAGLDYWHMRFFDNMNVFVVADVNAHTDNITEMIKTFHDNDTCGRGAQQKRYRPLQKKPMPQNKKGLRLSNNSMTEQDSGDNSNPGTSGTVNVLHMSENAKWRDPENAETSLLNSVPRKGYAFVVKESTAFGMNKFAEDCEASMKGKSSWEFVFITWLDMPDCCDTSFPGELLELTAEEKELMAAYEKMDVGHIKFRRRQVELLGSPTLFRQDFPLNPREPFLTSGANFFNPVLVQQRIDEIKFFRDWKADGIENLRAKYPDILMRIKHHPRGERAALARMEDDCVVPRIVTFTENVGSVTYIHNPEAKLNEGAALMFRDPKRTRKYLVVIDVAEGKRTKEYESDDSAIQVFDCYSKEQVLEWAGVYDEEMTAEIGVMIAKVYGNAIIVPEMNNKCGGLLLAKLESTGYKNIYRREIIRGNKREREIGWDTKAGVKKEVFGTFRLDFKNGDCLLHSLALLEQMLFFMDKAGKLEAAEGKKDDRVMAAGVALKVISVTPDLRLRGQDKEAILPSDYVNPDEGMSSSFRVVGKRSKSEVVGRYI